MAFESKSLFLQKLKFSFVYHFFVWMRKTKIGALCILVSIFMLDFSVCVFFRNVLGFVSS